MRERLCPLPFLLRTFIMNLLNLEHISKSYNSRMLLDDVTLGIHDTDKIGNGSHRDRRI